MIVHRLQARTDNYVWLLHDPASKEAAVVDASEAAPVVAALERLGAELKAIWCTHHHFDHVGGNEELCARWPGVEVVGGSVDAAEGRIPRLTRAVGEGDVVRFAGRTARVLFIPGHTRGHVAYAMDAVVDVAEGTTGDVPRVFCGDTLFGGGCGRLFEGTPAQMRDSLAKLRELPDDTLVHCGHEYTWHNLRWAVETGIEPANGVLTERHARVAADPAQLTVPTRLGEEKATNPFLRWDVEAVRRGVGAAHGESDDEVFARIRRAKDVWKA
jgi:hydroxyacylglutathione hydrolase